MKRIPISLVLAGCLQLGATQLAPAQEPNPQAARLEKIILQDQEPVLQRSNDTQGGFAPITFAPLGSATVRLEFPAAMANRSVRLAAMDGGQISGVNGDAATIDADGKLPFQFAAPAQPGLYRIIVMSPNSESGAGGVVAVVQLEVPQE